MVIYSTAMKQWHYLNDINKEYWVKEIIIICTNVCKNCNTMRQLLEWYEIYRKCKSGYNMQIIRITKQLYVRSSTLHTSACYVYTKAWSGALKYVHRNLFAISVQIVISVPRSKRRVRVPLNQVPESKRGRMNGLCDGGLYF